MPEVDVPAPAPVQRHVTAPSAPVIESEVESEAEPVVSGSHFHGRPNRRFYFPNDHILDQYAPPILVLISVGWVCGEMFRSNELGRGWVPVLRIVIFWALYCGIVFPLMRIGSIAAGKSAQVQPPPGHTWRVFATFCFPATLAYILWSINGGIASFILSSILGIAMALGLHMLFYRLLPLEAKKALPVVGGWYAGSIVLCVIAIMTLNFVLESSLSAARSAHEFAFSPMGHFLKWNPAAPPADPHAPQPKQAKPFVLPDGETLAKDNSSTTSPATKSVALAPAVKPVIPPPVIAPVTPPAVQLPTETPAPPITNASVEKPPANTSVFSETPTNDPFAEINPPPKENKEPKASAVDAPIEPPPAEVDTQALNSSVAERATPAAQLGSFHQIIFPTVPSSFVATVKTGEEDTIDVWGGSPKTKKGSATFQRDLALDPSYALSPNGQTITRVAAFPALSIQVWSVAEARVTRSIGLNKAYGTPTALGFSDDKLIWILWDSAGKYGLESFDVQTGARQKQVEMLNYERSTANFAFSPDGKNVAFLRSSKAAGVAPELAVIGTRTGQQFRRFVLPGVDRELAVQISGLAFSPDSNKIALTIEHNNQGLLLAWNLQGSDTKPLYEHLFPGGFRGDKTLIKQRTRALEWLANGTGWVINGSGVYDAATGRLLGELGVTRAISQHVVDNSTVEIVSSERPTTPEAAKATPARLYSVQLKPAK